MLICLDQRTGTGCGYENRDGAQFCGGCGKSLRFALQLCNPGDVVNGRYRIVRVIGHGGFGAVYEAVDLQGGGHVALKETFDPAEIQHYRAEFAVLSALAHPHLPRYFEVFEANGNGYLVMEYVPGQSLADVLGKQGGPLLETVVLGYALQLCDALSFLHGQTPPIIHRDIKPANVRLTPEGVIKLVDFGLVKEGTGATVISRRAVTPAYAPPEQWGMGGQHTEPRSDLYALSATLYHLFTGLEPPAAIDRMSSPSDPILVPKHANPALSQRVSDAVTAALKIRINERPGNAQLLRRLLIVGASAAPLMVMAGMLTGIGLVREINEDSLLRLELDGFQSPGSQPLRLYAVADGGGTDGAVGSKVALEALGDEALRLAAGGVPAGLNYSNLLLDAARKAAWAVYDAECDRDARNHFRTMRFGPMSTTLVAVLVDAERMTAHVINVGDSRLYKLDAATIRQVTKDHSLVQLLVDAGQITPAEARHHPDSGLMYRNLSLDPNVEIDRHDVPLAPGDFLLLCSEGLCGLVDDPEMHAAVVAAPTPQAACARLIELAKAAGGHYNISTIVVSIS